MSLFLLKKKIQEELNGYTASNNTEAAFACIVCLTAINMEVKEIQKEINYLEKRIEPFRGQTYVEDQLTAHDSELRIWKRVLGKDSPDDSAYTEKLPKENLK